MRYLNALLTRSNEPRAPFDQPRARRSLAARKIAFRRRALFLEQLEDRRVLSAISWDGGGGDSNWYNALNWDTDTVPGPLDNVSINATVDASDDDVTVFDLNLQGALSGTADVVVSGAFDWGGGLFGSGSLTANGGMSISPNVFLYGRTLTNAGAAVWHGGFIETNGGAVINNLAGATFEAQSESDLIWNGGAQATFHNAGSFRKTGTAFGGVNDNRHPGTGLDAVFHNTGTVEAQAGRLSFVGGFTQTTGETVLNGGSVGASSPLQVLGGTVEGTGAIFAHVSNGGQVSPGLSSGLIDLHGNYFQTSTGAFKAEIGGYMAGTHYDRLNVTGSVVLGGALNLSVINGFATVDGDLFTIIDNDSTDAVVGTFNGLLEGSIFSISGGNQFKISYNGFGTSNDVVVKAVNRPPTVGDPSVPDPFAVNSTVNVSANFTDPDIQDTHTAVWDWDDGSTSTGTVSETNGSGSVTGSHVYSAAGVYSVKLTVTDNHNLASTSLSSYVVVYDPSAGFVTGGGWIYSPAGAYTADPALTGKATFGFVSKNQNGATVPTGNTEFQFKVADFNFKSTSYEWLVVAGARAQYKGEGTINDTGIYSFMLTAIDGQVNGGGGVDKFRIRIWDKDTGGLRYDNQVDAPDDASLTTTLGGGSIVIHKDNQASLASSVGALGSAAGTPIREAFSQAVDQAINYLRDTSDLDAAELLDHSSRRVEAHDDLFASLDATPTKLTAKQFSNSVDEDLLGEDLVATIAQARRLS